MKQNNPWKGLDSYNETDRLYGRDEEIEVLFSRIEYNVQTVVYSSSGIGKSSLIRAGIFPKARQAGMLPVSIRLQHSASKNEHHTPYIDQVKNAVDEQLSQHNGWKEEVMPHKNDHEETLWEYLHRFRFYVDTDGNRKQVTPLLVFDQFDLLNEIYGEDKAEGVFTAAGTDKKKIGGFGGFVVNELSRGFGDGLAIDGTVDMKDRSMEEVKEGIRRYGALYIGAPDAKKGYHDGYYTMNFPDARPAEYDHSIAVLGWDDHFPREDFQIEASLMKELAGAPIALWFDTGHARVRECRQWDAPAAEVATRLATWVRGMHLNDVKDIHDDHFAPGKGNVDFASLKPLAQREGMLHVVEPHSEVTAADLRAGLAIVRRIWKEELKG